MVTWCDMVILGHCPYVMCDFVLRKFRASCNIILSNYP